MDLKAVIPIGGRGTRLKEITGNIPKPIFPIFGKSTLYRACEILLNQGITKILITIGYSSKECIEHIYFIKSQLNLSIDIYQEKVPLGESGGLWHITDKLSENFIFINGDLIFSLDFNRLLNFHKRLKSDLTLITHTSNHPFDSDLLSSPNGTFVENIFSKNEANHNKVNAYLGFSAIAVINKKLLENIPPPKDIKYSSLFHHLVRKSFDKNYRIFSYNTTEYIKDMGTPKRFKEVKYAIKNNRLEIQNYKNKQKALFIDRDNTLIKCNKKDYILDDSELNFLTNNIKKIAEKAKDFTLVILVTNQPQIAMGFLKIEDLEKINSKIINTCLDYLLKIDVISFCPHHPHKGFKYEIPSLKTDCFCRKPKPGMLIEQSLLRNIDLSKSLMVGDSISDKEAALSAGCNFLFINDL